MISLVTDALFVVSGVLRSLYIKQKAPPHPPLCPKVEAQPGPLFHQLQRGRSQVGDHCALTCFTYKHFQFWKMYLFCRLYLLVQLFGGVQAAEFSSRLSPAERKHTLKDFQQGNIQL